MTRTNDADDADDEASRTDDTAEAVPVEEAVDGDPVSLRTDRRDYLRALGGVGTAGMVGSLTVPSATAQSNFDEAAADQRIRENQTGPLTVEVVDENGAPVSNADVDVEMTEHDFGWGNMINVDNLLNRFGEGSDYYRHLRELFNTAVLENAHKWAIWEGNRQAADDAVDWLDENGFRIRGHTCVYGVEYAIPSNVQTAADNGDGQTVRDETMQQIEEIITHYGDQIQEWDVVNEAVHRGHLQEGVYPGEINAEEPMSSQRSPWTTQLLADWYAKSESVVDENGLDVEIGTNDYNTLTWDQDPYYEQVQFLADQGVDVDFMGHQAHIGPTDVDGQQWNYGIVNQLFERFADLPATQRITEYDMAGDSWSGHQQRADVMRAFLKTAYGHPDVDEFTIWGMWDETHWKGEAPFFEEDWSEKPALDEFRSLVHDEWWTSESGTTDASGTVTVDAFLGDHEILVDGEVVGTASVTDADAGRQVTVSVEGEVGTELPSVGENENPPTDPDGDGLYEDVNGNGGQDLADAVDLYQNRDSGAVQNNVDAYDFSGNDEIDLADVVQLYQENTN